MSRGAIIDYEGGPDSNGVMRLEGEIRYQEGAIAAAFRSSWSAQKDGSVVQKLEQYDAEQAAWQDWFTGIYRRSVQEDN